MFNSTTYKVKIRDLPVHIHADHELNIWMVSNNEIHGLFLWPFKANLRRIKKVFTELYMKHPNIDNYFSVNMRLLRTLIYFSFLDFKLVNPVTNEYIGRQKNEDFCKFSKDCNIRDYIKEE